MKYLVWVLWIIVFGPMLLVDAEKSPIVWSQQEQPIYEKIKTLRSLPDDVRAATTKQLAFDVRALPKTANKLALATDLASLSTEGDFGQQTLQEVTTTLVEALRQQPQAAENGQPAYPYIALAQLERYENVTALLSDPQYAAAKDSLATDDERRQHADFTLTDLDGRSWNLRSLKGKIVLVNFWATWCPPCRKELPDLEQIYEKYKDQGLVVLAITDEQTAKVKPFILDRKLTYPILLDPSRKVNDALNIEGIPRSFVYDRDGKIVAQAIDMRTRKQFDAMLAAAGLK
jgi:peroxiredoxin